MCPPFPVLPLISIQIFPRLIESMKCCCVFHCFLTFFAVGNVDPHAVHPAAANFTSNSSLPSNTTEIESEAWYKNIDISHYEDALPLECIIAKSALI